ncbi:Uncharacterized protein APZ42_025011 [Daphnia magna]|uniref:Uncharacterized protein n=1 Tax=Daphnia magna TaxID=35525 RepID=A0A164TJL9_9CRUS|nr:Uncharacterized protein APZ42_025011 [Daphnia magna]
MKTQNPTRRLNATVPVLLSGWWTKSELSLLRLARRACPSIPGSKAKPKFPEDMIENFLFKNGSVGTRLSSRLIR